MLTDTCVTNTATRKSLIIPSAAEHRDAEITDNPSAAEQLLPTAILSVNPSAPLPANTEGWLQIWLYIYKVVLRLG